MSKVRDRFTNAEVEAAVSASQSESGVNYQNMSKLLSDNSHGTKVTPQLCRYWARQFDKRKKNGEPYLTLTVANRDLKEKRKLRKPNRYEDLAVTKLPVSKHKCILVIPDQHAPYQHKDTLDFLAAVAAKYRPDTVVNLGDELDNHAISFHDSDPDLDSAGIELEKAKEFIHKLHAMFPVMRVCHSNHGSLVYRKAHAHGLPAQLIKSYRDVLFQQGGGEQWEWQEDFKLRLPNGDKVLFKHEPAGDPLADAAHNRCNLVTGHLHGKFSINSAASTEAYYWAASAGCLIDKDSMAFAYGKNHKNKPIIGCLVIKDSLPILVPMRLTDNGEWNGKL
ncbi:phosphatase 2a-like protein [Aeromonas phage vB_AspA_Tola]|nr:phosphatase 2a-like protein [Aeromonas phage vB_AspA_Tola]